jgi:hexokinase
MARYKHTEAEGGQGMFLTVNLKEQLLPGTFEYMLNDLVGTKLTSAYLMKITKTMRKGRRRERNNGRRD